MTRSFSSSRISGSLSESACPPNSSTRLKHEPGPKFRSLLLESVSKTYVIPEGSRSPSDLL
ncbi:hypothetical protein PO909_010599 [Leuciscus waleckii]